MPALRLKATKTSLYKLVNQYTTLPILKRTEFWKAFRSPDFYLEWATGDGREEAFLSTCCGRPLLSLTVRDDDRHTVSRVVYKLSLEDLKECGMVEAVKLPGEIRAESIPHSCETCGKFEGMACEVLNYKDFQTDCEHWEMK